MSADEPEVIVDQKGAWGRLTLNRPQGLNALTLGMVRTLRATLDAWAEDERVGAVLLQGAGDKAFCAGGDIRDMYDSYKAGDSRHQTFFEEEYALDQLIHQYPKPLLVLMNGIVMGGGMGLAQGADLRIVSERARLAMPETGIGYFPDVGASFFLGRLPGRLGEYLAVTGAQLGAADALHAGLADEFVAADSLPDLMAALQELDEVSLPSIKKALAGLAGEAGQSVLSTQRTAIDEHFSGASVPAIQESLDGESRPEMTEWAEKTRTLIDRHSPLAMAVALELVRRGRELSLPQAFALELHLDRQWFDHGDIVEGIRALLVDKDKTPQWQPPTLEQLQPRQVAGFFESFRPPTGQSA